MKFLILLFGLLLFNSPSQAFLFIEPWIGAEGGSQKIEYTPAGEAIKGSSTETANLRGTTGGLRLGIQLMSGPWIAISSSLTQSGKMTFEDHEFKYERSTLGANLGYRFGRLSLFVGHNPTDTLTQSQSPSSEKDICQGSSNLVGISYLIISHVSLNIEALEHNFKECTSEDLILNDFNQSIKTFKHFSPSAYLSFPF